MTIAEMIRAMAAAGAPAEAIAIAVEALEASEEARRRPARERKQRQRDAERAAREIAGQSQDDSVTVTGQVRDTPSTPSLSSPQTPQQTHPHTPENNNTRARGTRLPANFDLPGEWRDWARAHRGWSDREVNDEAASFADYWRGKAGRDAVKVDWAATWRNWVRNSRRVSGERHTERPKVPL